MEVIQWYKGRQVDAGTQVKTYFNLHKKVFSIVAMEGEYKGKVVGHSKNIILAHPTFEVSQAGRSRVIKEQRKNVHAFVHGSFCGALNEVQVNSQLESIEQGDLGDWVTYNPYKADHFQNLRSGVQVEKATVAFLIDKKVWVV